MIIRTYIQSRVVRQSEEKHVMDKYINNNKKKVRSGDVKGSIRVVCELGRFVVSRFLFARSDLICIHSSC